MIIRLSIWFTIIWLGALAGYVLLVPHLFARMFPHEVGEFLAGWFAPLAATWVGVAVWLQRQQLIAQTEELKHSSEALRLQSEQFQRSINLMEQSAVATRLDRLRERVILGVLRIVKNIERQEVQSPVGERVKMESLFGSYSFYGELFRGRETELAMSKFGEGLARLTQNMQEDWVLGTTRAVINELCIDLTYLDRIGADMDRIYSSLASSQISVDTIDSAVLAAFRIQVANADRALEALRFPTDETDIAT